MINPGDIVNAVVLQLRDIPELATAQGASASIGPYHPIFAAAGNFRTALHAANPGDILVRWLGTGAGSFGENRIWKHQIGVYVRSFDSASDDQPGQHYLSAKLIVDGIPATAGIKILDQQLLSGLDPMDIPTLQVIVDSEGLEYFLITFAIPEIGDN